MLGAVSVQCAQLLTLNKQSSLTHWINICKWQTMTKQKISLCLTYGRTQDVDFSFGQDWLQFKCSIQVDIIIAFLRELLCPRRKMQRLARRRAIATVGSGWQQLWHRVWMEDGWRGGGQGEEAGGAASPGGHLWRPLHTWWDLLVSLNNKKKSSGLFFIITVTLRHHEQVFNYTTSIVTHHWKSWFYCLTIPESKLIPSL